MKKVYIDYTCDFCGKEIARTFDKSFMGNEIELKKGIVGEPLTLDLCDHCYMKLKEYCVQNRQ